LKWKQDPTISSMLIMLDEIQNIFKDDNLFENLKKNITFSFLKPEKLNIKNGDELYIKMNSRGKPLNEFENFKSYFTAFLNDQSKIKFDNDWFDIFWSTKVNNSSKELTEEIIEKEIFVAYLNFFKNITAFYSEEFNEVNILKFKYNIPLIKRWQKDKPETYDILLRAKTPIDEIIKTLYCLTIDKKKPQIGKIITELRDRKVFQINIFQDFLKEKITYEERLRFYALIKFFNKIGKAENNEILFKQWMRVSFNLIHNTLYNKLEDYQNDIKMFDKLIEILDNNFYENLSKSTLRDTMQFQEEKLKAKLICCENSKEQWEENFIDAENNWYLDGQIRFLIEYSKNNEKQYVLEYFIKYTDKFKKLWNFVSAKKDKKENEMLLHRALLTFGEYLPKQKNS